MHDTNPLHTLINPVLTVVVSCFFFTLPSIVIADQERMMSGQMDEDMVIEHPMRRGYGYGGPMGGPGWMGGMGPMGGGHMMGPGSPMGGGHMMGALLGLDLSKEQLAKVRKLYRTARKESFSLMNKMMETSDQLYDLYAEETLDADKIGKVYDKIFTFRRQMIQQHIRTANKVNELLDEKQKEKFRTLRQNAYGMM